MIPRRLIRTIPQQTNPEVERWWEEAKDLHPRWEYVTWQDPIFPGFFPITSRYWDTCESGAQLADLIRLEDLYTSGGVYIDSDIEVYKSFEPLIGLQGFAAYEDVDHIPNAVMGFESGHPAVGRALELALERHNQGTWAAGVGVTTEVFRERKDMLLLPPGSFYGYHYSVKDAYDPSTDYGRRNLERLKDSSPWAYCVHHWRHSWAKA